MNVYALGILFSTKLLPLLYAIIGFGLLITIHECGHFLFCKLFNIHTPTFSIGMGPSIFQRQIGKTKFRLAIIPIGGYVEIAGMAEVGQGEQAHSTDVSPISFRSKPYWQKFFVLTGGILFNIFFAYVVFSALYFIGMPIQKEVKLVIKKVGEPRKGEDAIDLQGGDELVGVNNRRLSSDPRALYPVLRKIAEDLSLQKEEPTELRLLRAGKEIVITVPGGSNGTNLQRGLLAGASLDLETVRVEYERHSIFQAIRKGIEKTHDWIYKFILSIKMLATKHNIKDFGGPIMIVSQSFKMAQEGLLLLFVFLAIISINLAIINLLPIGALDGGQLLFETIEAIIRRPIPDFIRFSINLMSWILILGLLLFLTYQDILALLLRYFP